MELPRIKTDWPMRMWGGAGSSFVVNKAAPNKDKAVAFLKWLTARDQQVFLSEATNNLPANREALAAIPQILADFARVLDATTHPSVWPVDEDPVVVEVFTRGIQSIMIGESSPDKVAASVADVKRRQMNKTRI